MVRRPWQRAAGPRAGVEAEGGTGLWRGRVGWYAAMDLSAFEENDWDRDVTLQAGLVLRERGLARTYRLGAEYYEGRPWMGEFFQDRERYLAFGIWFDL